MAHKPEIESDAVKTVRGKAKASPAIDLPASEVIEVKPQDVAPESAPNEAVSAEPSPDKMPETAISSPPATPSAPSRLMPGLIGLVAGAIGGFGAYHVGEFARPKAPATDRVLVDRLGALEQRLAALKPGDAGASVPQAVIERLDRAETALVQVSKGHELLGVELGKLGAALGTEVTERKKLAETVGRAPSQAVGVLAPQTGADLDGLKSRLGTVEAMQPRVESVAKDVQALSSRIAGLAARDTLGAANARLAAVSLLEDGFGKGRPLTATLDILKNLGTDSAMLAAFAPFAAAGAPDARKLLDELRAITPPPAPGAAPANQGLIDRLKQGAASLVEVRRTGEVTGTDDAAHLAGAEQALQRGHIPAAAAFIARLSAARAPAYASWRSRAEARLRAADTLVALRGDAVAALAKAASAQ